MAKLTLRSVKGSPLTNTELDGNFEYFTGSHAITGSLIVTGGITGSLHSVISSSYAATASNAVSASYAQTASYVTTAQTASYVTTAQTASYVTTAQTASYVSTASYAENALSASYAPSPFPYVGDAEFSGSILISGSIIPNTDGVSLTSSFSLGSPTAAWKDIYVSDGTINFLDGAGNVQGTIGAGTNATVITGSLVTVPSFPLTEFAISSTVIRKSYTTSDCIFALATSISPTAVLNPQIYSYGIGPCLVLPWDRKITSYILNNNINANLVNVSSLVSLPPIFNAGYSIGETVTVYNIGETQSYLKSSGSIYITATVQGITQVNTASKSITATFNSGYIISGSWGTYTNLNVVLSSTTESIKIDPGQKATFEIAYMGDITPGVSASLFQVPGNGYSTNQTNSNPSTTYVTYLFKGIENL